jgi:regulator of sirC expression with transglutaminase-like and TPR domain
MHVEAAAVELRRALANEPVRLDLVALAIARLDDEGDGRLDDGEVLTTLDDWARLVRGVAQDDDPRGREALAVVLGEQVGLHGKSDEYDAPENSFLHRVVARRRGLPILLSLVYLEVARRAEVPLFGLALPGHFVVARPTGPDELTVLDPFAGGRTMSPRELAALVAQFGARLDPSLFVPASPRTIAIRMLRNLVASYQRRAQVAKTHAAARLWLAIDPDDATARLALEAAATVAAADDDGLN